MQAKRLSATLVGLAIASLTHSAFAVMSVPYGWFVEANIGSSKINSVNYPGSVSTSGVGANINAGYKFMPYLAAELGYTRYANTSIEAADGTAAATVKNYSYDFAARGILPIGCSGFEAFAKLGIGRMISSVSVDNAVAATSLGLSSSSHSATGLYLGAGAQYYFMPELAIVGQWQRIQGSSSTGNGDLLSIGLSFIFD